MLGLWLRWSWRDLRRRWVLVSTIALIIAIGTGVFAGLGGTSDWRRRSQDASYARLLAHDVRAVTSTGTFVPEGSLASAVRQALPEAVAVEERLVVSTQVDASTAAETILVPGRLVGIDVAAGGTVDLVHVADGVGLADGARAVLEAKFAAAHDLPPSGTILLGGDRALTYDGLGFGPGEFLVRDRLGGVFGEAGFAIVYLPLTTAQELAGLPGAVDQALVRLPEGADRQAAAERLEEVLAGALPEAAVSVETSDDDPVRTALYEDADNDQQTWNVFAFLILLSASFAAFNLISRIVESERREIGVGMAIGAPPRLLAVRPMLVGAQVALIGVVLGVVVGVLFGAGMRRLLVSFLPLPVWETPFQVGRFARAAALGVALPVVATVVPVWRAVRAEPVEATRSSAYSAMGRGGRLTDLLRRVPTPGRRITTQLPFRNVVRAPRRSLLTVLGIGISITALVVVLGALDTWLGAIDRGQAEASRVTPDRVVVDLDRFYPVDGEELRGLLASPVIARAEAGLKLVGQVRAGPDGEEIDLLPEVVDLSSPIWSPTLLGAVGDVRDGIVLSEKAARDLGVRPGDQVIVRHPQRVGLGYRLVDSTLPVSALQPNPLRFTAFLDRSQAARFGLEGLANTVQVDSAVGVDELKRALFGLPGVASVQPVSALGDVVENLIEQFIGILRLLEGAVLALALLIAFNSASISADERAREEATMFAFGVRVRTVLGMLTAESVLLGIVGTVLGLVVGFFTLRWMIESMMAETMPDVGFEVLLTPGTMLATVVLGVLAVALAPLFTARRLHRMDIPSTLRVLE